MASRDLRAVAMAAALNVTEPCSTGKAPQLKSWDGPLVGIGGDACALYYSSSEKKVHALCGFGRSAGAFTEARIAKAGFLDYRIPTGHGLTVTVPGAAQLWEDVVTHWGRTALKEVLQPATELCENGFPVESTTAGHWQKCLEQLKGEGCASLKSGTGKAPVAGEWVKNPDLARTFRTVAEKGAQHGFYRGRIAEAIVAETQKFGGAVELEDLHAHQPAQPEDPACTDYRGYTVWEIPPPSQGVVVLAALNHLEALLRDPGRLEWGIAEVLHAQIEALRLAFFDALQRNADPRTCDVPLDEIICKREATRLRTTHQLSRQASSLRSSVQGEPQPSVQNTDTVYLCAVDSDGNACSLINSNFMGFGTGIVPEGCGFSLHNRGSGFCRLKGHPNFLGPSKRPYNTIIPGMVTASGSLFCAFGVMGGFMQPQGHLQVLSNLIDFKMNPQAALDAPRFCITGVDSAHGPRSVQDSKSVLPLLPPDLSVPSSVSTELGFGATVVSELLSRGHDVTANDQDCFYGRGQIILRTSEGVLWGGTEPRAGGCAIGY